MAVQSEEEEEKAGRAKTVRKSDNLTKNGASVTKPQNFENRDRDISDNDDDIDEHFRPLLQQQVSVPKVQFADEESIQDEETRNSFSTTSKDAFLATNGGSTSHQRTRTL